MHLFHSSSLRISRLPILFLALSAVASCTSTSSLSGAQAVDRITDRLVESAELRTDVRSLRVCVHWIREVNPQAGVRVSEIGSRHGRGKGVEQELQHRFIDSLSNRLNVIEFELAEQEDPEVMTSGMEALIEAYGVTHILVGDFVRRGKELDVSVRLVEADTLLIVASANGPIPIAALGDDIRGYHRHPMSLVPFSGIRPAEGAGELAGVWTGDSESANDQRMSSTPLPVAGSVSVSVSAL